MIFESFKNMLVSKHSRLAEGGTFESLLRGYYGEDAPTAWNREKTDELVQKIFLIFYDYDSVHVMGIKNLNDPRILNPDILALAPRDAQNAGELARVRGEELKRAQETVYKNFNQVPEKSAKEVKEELPAWFLPFLNKIHTAI